MSEVPVPCRVTVWSGGICLLRHLKIIRLDQSGFMHDSVYEHGLTRSELDRRLAEPCITEMDCLAVMHDVDDNIMYRANPEV